MSDTEEKIKVMQAFVDGKTIIQSSNADDGFKDTELITEPLWRWYEVDYKIKQNWHDNIPEPGVICFVSSSDNLLKKNFISIIKFFNKEKSQFVSIDDIGWGFAKPMSKSELKIYLDNAPK